MKNIYGRWKGVAEKIGNFQATLIFSLLYFLLLTPVGLLASRFRDFLGITKPRGWEKIPENASTLTKLGEQ